MLTSRSWLREKKKTLDSIPIYLEEYIPLRTILLILAACIVSRQQNKGVKLCRGEVSLYFLPLALLEPSLPRTRAPTSLRVCLQPPLHCPHQLRHPVTASSRARRPHQTNQDPDEHQGYRISDAGMAWDSDRII